MDIKEFNKLIAAASNNVKKIEAVAALIPAQIEETKAKRDALLSGRRAKLLTAPDTEIAALDGQAAALLLYIERLEVLAEDVDTDIARLRHDNAAASVAARQAAVIKQCADAAAKIRNDLSRYYNGITDVLCDVAKADIALEDFYRFAADNGVPVDQLAGPEEMARTGKTWPAEVVEEAVVTRWVFAETGNRINHYDVDAVLPPPSDGKVIAAIEDGRRLFLYRSSPSAIPAEVVRKQFRKVTIKRAVRSPTPLTLAKTIALPGVVGGESDVWAPSHFYSARGVLDELQKRTSRSPSGEPARQMEVQWIPLPESGEADLSSSNAA